MRAIQVVLAAVLCLLITSGAVPVQHVKHYDDTPVISTTNLAIDQATLKGKIDSLNEKTERIEKAVAVHSTQLDDMKNDFSRLQGVWIGVGGVIAVLQLLNLITNLKRRKLPIEDCDEG